MFAARPAANILCNVPIRGMATLKDLRLRLRSVKNIQKITKSMKMVAAAKFAKAERDLRIARPYGQAAVKFFDSAEAKLDPDETSKQLLLVVMTSDRGLCGAVHSNVVRSIRGRLATIDPGKDNVQIDPKVVAAVKTPADVRLATIGDKARAMLHKQHGRRFVFACNEIGRKPSVFADAGAVAEEILHYWARQGDAAKNANCAVVYNVFRSVVSYRTTTQALPVPASPAVANAGKISLYDSIDDTMLQCYNEFALANLIFFAMREAQTSEQSSRMTAMDGAAKNAGEMINKLTIQMNRTRQAVITRELVEIIAGAAALK